MPVYDPQEWPLEMCKVKEAWALPLHEQGKTKGEGITILHPDTGWTEHPELIKGGRYLYNSTFSKNFMTETSETGSKDTLDSGVMGLEAKNRLLHPSHGTCTAGLMMSEEGHPNSPLSIFPDYTPAQSEFITGIAPMVKVLPCRIGRSVLLDFLNLSINETSRPKALTNAITHGISLPQNQGVGVISISFGGKRHFEYLNVALKAARQNGLIVIAAAGQELPFSLPFSIHEKIRMVAFPGRSPHTICVAGCHKNFDKGEDASYGAEVDITAPGWGVIVPRTEWESNKYKYFIDKDSNGTSYSTALTAGACALWLAFHNRDLLIKKYGRPFLLDVFRHVLKKTAHEPNGWDSSNRGKGILNVLELLKCELPPVEVIEAEAKAKANDWPETEWGGRANWGRE